MKSSTSHNGNKEARKAPTTLRARPSGLTGSTLVLEDDRESLGTLALTSPGEVRLEGSGLVGSVEKSMTGYRLKLGETEVTATRERGKYRLRSADTIYEARLNPLKNSAQARCSVDGRNIEVRGRLLSRSYEIVFESHTDGAFEVAILLLYMTATLRRRAFTV